MVLKLHSTALQHCDAAECTRTCSRRSTCCGLQSSVMFMSQLSSAAVKTQNHVVARVPDCNLVPRFDIVSGHVHTTRVGCSAASAAFLSHLRFR